MTSTPTLPHDEPAFVACEARLAQLATPTPDGIPAMAAALLQYAHNELTDYGAHTPTTRPVMKIGDPTTTVRDILKDLALLLTSARALPYALRITRAIDYTREADAVLDEDRGPESVDAVDEDGSPR